MSYQFSTSFSRDEGDDYENEYIVTFEFSPPSSPGRNADYEIISVTRDGKEVDEEYSDDLMAQVDRSMRDMVRIRLWM